MAKWAGIDIRIGADTRTLGRDLRKADGLVGKFSKAASTALTGVAIAATGAAIKIGVDGVKAYVEDEKAARTLAVTLENVTKAKESQVAAVEDYITKTQFAAGVADDELRPAFARLIRSTQDIAKSQKILNVALDVSKGTGKSLDSVVAALGKSYDGSNASLSRLGLGLDATLLKEGEFSDIMKQLRHDFQGFAEADANTMEGKLARLNLRFNETKEQIGGILLQGLDPLMEWFQTAEGEEAIQNFMKGLKATFQAIADLVPIVISGLKKLGTLASGLNINFEDIMTPEMLAAAAAFRVALPLGLPAATLAGVTAWAVAHDSLHPAQVTGNVDKNLTVTSMFDKVAAKNAELAPTLIGAGVNVKGVNPVMGFSGTSVMLPKQQTININVSGAVDPAGTAIAVQRAINKSNRLGIGGAYLGTGLG